jgi:hypothetical protein
MAGGRVLKALMDRALCHDQPQRRIWLVDGVLMGAYCTIA